MRNAFVGAFICGLAALAWAAPHKHRVAYLKVKKFKPKHTQVLVPVGAAAAVTFSRPIDVSTVTSETADIHKLSGEPVPVTMQLILKGRVLVIKPVAALDPGTDYVVSVRPGILSDRGTTLKTERHANFFTNPNVSPFALLRPDQFVSLVSTMVEGRAAHSATTMTDGRVLLAGGMSDYTTYDVTGDVFDPRTNRFHPSGGQLGEQRAYHPATPFDTGVILIGGAGTAGALQSTEIYSPELLDFRGGPPLREPRDFVAAVALMDGRVLVVGGLSYAASGGAIYSTTAEIYDPAAGEFRFTRGAPLVPRAGHTLSLLPDGRVLVVGGQSGSSAAVAELFDPDSETFTATAGAPEHNRQLHSATVIDGIGDVLIADGGSGLLELYDPTTDGFHPAGGASSVNRVGATASVLPNGNVLIAGGLEDRGGGVSVALDGFDLYIRSDGDFGSVVRTNVVFPEPRYGHSATTVVGGKVLYAGGFGQSSTDSLDTGVLFTPDPAK